MYSVLASSVLCLVAFTPRVHYHYYHCLLHLQAGWEKISATGEDFGFGGQDVAEIRWVKIITVADDTLVLAGGVSR